jgi:hypothetical protein
LKNWFRSLIWICRIISIHRQFHQMVSVSYCRFSPICSSQFHLTLIFLSSSRYSQIWRIQKTQYFFYPSNEMFCVDVSSWCIW